MQLSARRCWIQAHRCETAALGRRQPSRGSQPLACCCRASRQCMKTLHVVASVEEERGGSARAVLEVCAGLTEAGSTPTVVATHASTASLKYLKREFDQVEV